MFEKKKKETATISNETVEVRKDIPKDKNTKEEKLFYQRFLIDEKDFGPFLQFIENDDITDINFNGSELWTIDCHNKHEKQDVEVTKNFIDQFAMKVANAGGKTYNQKNPVLEAETSDLRISVVHESIAVTGTSVCIRKTPPFSRIKEKTAIEEKYCTKEIMSLIVNCIKAHMNIIVGGLPHVGKTECCKFFSQYIPDDERVITVEDNTEWRYKDIKPEADCISMRTNKNFGYIDAIVASLRQDPQWLMIAETRGKEVRAFMEGLTTGVNGMSTLHIGNISQIPARMLSMSGEDDNSFKENIYEFIDVGVQVKFKRNPDGTQYRYISQVGFFYNDGDSGQICEVVKNGNVIRRVLPTCMEERMREHDIIDYFKNADVDNNLQQQGADIEEIEKRERDIAQRIKEDLSKTSELRTKRRSREDKDNMVYRSNFDNAPEVVQIKP